MGKVFFLWIRTFLFTLLLAFTLNSCKYDYQQFFFRSPTPDKRSQNLAEVNPPKTFSEPIKFMIVTDLHFGSDKFRAEDELVATLNNRTPDFIVLLGDVVETGKVSYYRQCEDFVKRIKTQLGYDLPIYVVLGNHDLYNGGLEHWEKLEFNTTGGKTVYKFETSLQANGATYSRSWYFLDTASGILGYRQLEALKTAMQKDPNPKFVFTHYPVYTDMGFVQFFKLSDDRERAAVIDLFDKTNVDMIFSGYWHPGGFFDYGNFSEICCQSFIENSDETCSWFYFSLDEEKNVLSMERHKVSEDKSSQSEQIFSMD